jgi:hypothetical protein
LKGDIVGAVPRLHHFIRRPTDGTVIHDDTMDIAVKIIDGDPFGLTPGSYPDTQIPHDHIVGFDPNGGFAVASDGDAPAWCGLARNGQEGIADGQSGLQRNRSARLEYGNAGTTGLEALPQTARTVVIGIRDEIYLAASTAFRLRTKAFRAWKGRQGKTYP